MSIKKSEAILKYFIDLKCSINLVETTFCDT